MLGTNARHISEIIIRHIADESCRYTRFLVKNLCDPLSTAKTAAGFSSKLASCRRRDVKQRMRKGGVQSSNILRPKTEMWLAQLVMFTVGLWRRV